MSSFIQIWTRPYTKKLHLQKTFVLAVFLFTFAVLACVTGAGEIHDAVKANDVLKVKAILKKSKAAVHSSLKNGISPLHLAAALNHTTIAELLISRGADVNARTSAGFTPFHWAAGGDAVDTAPLLIKRGADVNAQTDQGITPLYWAKIMNAPRMVEWLIASGAEVQEGKTKEVTVARTEERAHVGDEEERPITYPPDIPSETEAELSSMVLADIKKIEGTVARGRRWRVSAGYRHIQSTISFDTGSYLQDVNILSTLNANFGKRADVGNLTSFHDREYDDGYVRKDFGTEIDGDTWHWGYDSASQVQGGNLLFHAYDGIGLVGAGASSTVLTGWKDDTGSDAGFMVQADLLLIRSKKINGGILAGLSLSSFSAVNTRTQDPGDFEERFITDTYDLFGIIPPPPPYSGGIIGPAPVLFNTPSSRRVDTRAIPGVHSEITEALEIDLATISLGGFAEYNSRFWRLALSIGPTANFVKWDAARNELLFGPSSSSNPNVLTDQHSGSEWAIGYFGQMTIGVHVSERLTLGILGRYDWLDDISGTIGPSTYTAEFAGVSYGAHVGWSL